MYDTKICIKRQAGQHQMTPQFAALIAGLEVEEQVEDNAQGWRHAAERQRLCVP
jgi:hypothetical protein